MAELRGCKKCYAHTLACSKAHFRNSLDEMHSSTVNAVLSRLLLLDQLVKKMHVLTAGWNNIGGGITFRGGGLKR